MSCSRGSIDVFLENFESVEMCVLLETKVRTGCVFLPQRGSLVVFVVLLSMIKLLFTGKTE